ncbi:O-methyltransferase [Phaeacidiphilus oryzae]|uniref:O-methyltransferase n=1 Tax=Phaeacidiphilus oryzae TaxID=348818 RepID=UPI00068B94A8|nr:class I SAM-dependent methyltransferase [Phaeacidiphilus oryzae]
MADAFAAPEDEVLRHARAQAERAGVRAVSPGTGAVLRLLTTLLDAKSVVEIGTGTGVSGLHLLRGMRAGGVLTTVDVEPDRQRQARECFGAAGFAPNRTRLIPGAGLEVLPRLADGGYDCVFVDVFDDGFDEEGLGVTNGGGDRSEPEAVVYLREALRLLRPGGLVCFDGVGSAGEPFLRRELARDADSWGATGALLPLGRGLLCAARGR